MGNDSIEDGLGPGGRPAKLLQYHWRHKISQIVVTFVVNCRDVFFPVPFLPTLFVFAEFIGIQERICICNERIFCRHFHRSAPGTDKKITELIPTQFQFGNSSTQITEHNSQDSFGKGFGNPLLALLAETKQLFQKQFGSVISEQESPKTIRKQ